MALILRSMRALARMRLEGWRQARTFDVAVLRDALALWAKAPQDEVFD
jgi:hypothetical protein